MKITTTISLIFWVLLVQKSCAPASEKRAEMDKTALRVSDSICTFIDSVLNSTADKQALRQ